MFVTILLKHFGRKPPQVKSLPEDFLELLVQASNAQFLKVEVLLENLFFFHLVTVDFQLLIVLHRYL